MLMSLFDDQERLRHLLVIEVKLYSPKSGTAKIVKRGADADDEEEQLADIDKDQLVRYWRYLDELAQERAKQTKRRLQEPGAPREPGGAPRLMRARGLQTAG